MEEVEALADMRVAEVQARAAAPHCPLPHLAAPTALWRRQWLPSTMCLLHGRLPISRPACSSALWLCSRCLHPPQAMAEARLQGQKAHADALVGCNHRQWRLQLEAVEAATLGSEGCSWMLWGLLP